MTKKKFEEIYRNYYPQMYRLAKTILYDEDESKDVVGEVFLRMLRGDLYPQEDRMEGYLMTSVRNKCRDILNHKSVRERIEHLFSEEIKQSHIVTINDDDRLERLSQFVETELTPLTKKIFRLRFLHEMTYNEVAEMTGVSKVTVYNHLSKSLQQIKDYFSKTSKHKAKWNSKT